MELGTAVFVGLALLAVVLLYGFTKDRWPWRRVVLRSMVGLFGFVSIGIALIILFQYWEEFFPSRLGRQTEYLGLRLGMGRDEVRYVKGVPESVISGDKDADGFHAVLKTSELPKGKTADDYPLWTYERFSQREDVAFGGDNRVRSIGCFSHDKLYRCPAIGGVRDGTPEAEMLRRLGKPSRSAISGVSKSVEYWEIGVEFTLEKEAVYWVVVKPFEGKGEGR